MAIDGLPFIGAAGILLVALGVIASFTGSNVIWGFTYAEAVLLLFIIFFFRDPDRVTPEGEGLVISAADGKVVLINEVSFPELSDEKLIQVSVFLSIFDVHVNRVPISGIVNEINYYPGKFLAAWNDKASLENEQTLISIDTGNKKIYFKQIAGLIARRIVWKLETGQSVSAGERFGIIRFGSRVDILLPLNSEIRVKVGDKVRGGETVIGVINV